MDSIGSDILLALDALNDALTQVEELGQVEDCDEAYKVYLIIPDVQKALTAVKQVLGTKIGGTIGGDKTTLAGVPVKRHPILSRTKWDSDDLLRVVLDSRLIDPETGEVKEETQLEKIKAVYPLAGYHARSAALKARNIDDDEFCVTEFRGWSLSEK